MIARTRVLYVVHGHPDFEAGGGELAAYYMYEAMKSSSEYEPYLLARCGRETHHHAGSHLMVHERDERSFFLFTEGAQYDYFYDSFVTGAMVACQTIFRSFKELLLRLKPGVVHFHHYLHMGVDLIGFTKRVLPDCRIVLTLHEYIAICANKGAMIKVGGGQLCYGASPRTCTACFPERKEREFFLRERLFKNNFRVVDQFIAPSQFLKDRYVQWGIPASAIEVIDNGRPIWPRSHRSRRRESCFRVGFFGQIVFHKGLDVLLRAADEYRRRQHDWATKKRGPRIPELRFSVHGRRGHLPKELGEVIDDLLVQNSEVVRFRGGYHAREMMDLIGQVDCIVIPSVWWENSPLTVQEAFMAGVPVICSNIGGLAEKVEHGVNGLHFAVGDHLHLLEQILVLAGDNELYAKLTNTRGSVKSASEMSDDMHRVYGKALGSVVLELKRSKGLRVES